MGNERVRGDTPPSNPVLARLDRLVGEWETEVRRDGRTFGGGLVTFDWQEGGAFLVQRASVDDLSAAPTAWAENAPRWSEWVIGLDDSDEEFTVLYADSRAVYRVYRMTLRDGVWTMWRDAPGFSQRFAGTFDDRETIVATWEQSDDGVDWELDFDVTYERIGE